MRATMFGLATLLVVCDPAGVWAADPKDTIDAAIKAHGGKELLDKYPASKSKFAGDMSVMGLDISFEGSSVQAQGQFKLDMTADISGQKLVVSQIVNGTKVKTKQSIGGMDLPDMANEAQLDELRFSVVAQEIGRLTPLLAKPKTFSLKAEADEEVDGKKATVVTVTAKVGEKGEKTRDVKLYFDQKTNLLVKTARKGLAPGDPDGGEVPQESLLADYKKIDGLMIPMKTTSVIDGKKFMTMTVSEHVNLEKVDPKEFEMDN
jgi:hypothetical protein